MKYRFLLEIAIFAISLSGVITTSAQFTIKIPKLPKGRAAKGRTAVKNDAFYGNPLPGFSFP